jgi:hypothetical protein
MDTERLSRTTVREIRGGMLAVRPGMLLRRDGELRRKPGAAVQRRPGATGAALRPARRLVPGGAR